MALGNLRHQPSAGFVTFRLYRLSPPCRPLSPEGSGRHLRVHDLDGFLEPSPTGSDCRPLTSSSNLRQPGAIVVPALTDQRRKKLFLVVSEGYHFRRTFGFRHLREGAIPNSSPSWVRSDSDRPNPRRVQIDQDTCAKASPPKVGGGREPKVFCLHASRPDSPSF